MNIALVNSPFFLYAAKEEIHACLVNSLRHLLLPCTQLFFLNGISKRSHSKTGKINTVPWIRHVVMLSVKALLTTGKLASMCVRLFFDQRQGKNQGGKASTIWGREGE
jgi:hypothetical protein